MATGICWQIVAQTTWCYLWAELDLQPVANPILICVFWFISLQQIKKLQLLTQSAALNRETIAASQLATSTGSSGGGGGGSSQGTSSGTSGDSSTTLTASSGAGMGVGGGATSTGNAASGAAAAGKFQANRSNNGDAGATSILTVDEDTLSLDRLNSLRIYMTSVKTLPFNLRIYGWVDRTGGTEWGMSMGSGQRVAGRKWDNHNPFCSICLCVAFD